MPDLARIALFVAAAALAACGPRSGPPAPVSHGGDSRPALSRAEASSGVVVVQPGDTLYAVARRTGTPVRALIDSNRLQAPYRIQAGQRLQIPHVAAARPAPPSPASTDPAPPIVAAAPRGSVESAPIAAPEPTSAKPSAPESSAAASSGSGPAPVMPPPPAPMVNGVPVGTVVLGAMYPQYMPPGVAVRQPASGGGEGAPPVAPPATAAVPPSTGPSAPVAAPAPSAPVAGATPPPAVEAQPAARAGRFLWPVRGNIVSTFGQKPGGLQNDGINIAAPRGTPVRATENGVVVYAGNELKGFGNLLLLRHADGWMSAYAHLEEILVARGATVGRGQVVAKVGQTGSVATPQLHFELRRGGRAIDPRGQLAPVQTAEAN